MVICLERGADMHVARMMPLPLIHCLLLQQNPDWVLPFWYQLTKVFPEKVLLNVRVSAL